MVAGLEAITGGEIVIGDRVVNDARAEGSRHRDGVPELRALSAHERVRQHGVRPADPRPREGATSRSASSARRTSSSSSRCSSASRASSPAASGSASRWGARSSASRPCSCSTSRCRTSTRSCACRCASRSRSCIGGCRTTSLYVTHDQVEAMTLAQRMVVMNAGRAEQIGTPMEVYENPQTIFVAGFIGSPAMNFVARQGQRRRRDRARPRRRSAQYARDARERPRRSRSASAPSTSFRAAIASAYVAGPSRWSSNSAPTRWSTSATAAIRSSRACRTAHRQRSGSTFCVTADPARVFAFDAASGARMLRLTLPCADLAAPGPIRSSPRIAAPGKLAPENTLAAFRLGYAHGYRMAEFDVKLSADGVAFLLHDDTLDRTTDRPRPRRRADVARAGAARRGHAGIRRRMPASRWRRSPAWPRGAARTTLRSTSRSSQRVAASARPARRSRSTPQRCGRARAVKPLLSSFSDVALDAAREAAPELPRA